MKLTHNSYLFFIRLPLLLSIALLIGMGAFARRGWVDWRRMVHQNDDIHSRIKDVTSQRDILEKQLEAFRSDPQEQERVIRQALGYVRSDETVVEFD